MGEQLDVEAIRARSEAATEEPWSVTGFFVEGADAAIVGPDDDECVANAHFIAHARTDVPVLLDALAASEAARQEAEAALRDVGRCIIGFGAQRRIAKALNRLAALDSGHQEGGA